MVTAVEKQKLVYILTRDSSARLTISSPLEAHKAHTIVFSVCGVDVGFENPIFACLEVDYEEATQNAQNNAQNPPAEVWLGPFAHHVLTVLPFREKSAQ